MSLIYLNIIYLNVFEYWSLQIIADQEYKLYIYIYVVNWCGLPWYAEVD